MFTKREALHIFSTTFIKLNMILQQEQLMKSAVACMFAARHQQLCQPLRVKTQRIAEKLTFNSVSTRLSDRRGNAL